MEGLVKTVMECAEKLLENPKDYQARATMMWASTLALNGLPVAGIGKFEFPTHMIEHSLSSMYDMAHGAGLSIVTPGWMKYVYKKSPAKYAQFAERVFGIQEESPEKTAAKGIETLQAWFDKIGSPTTLTAGNIPINDIPKIAENADWDSLEILNTTKGGEKDDEGTVEFVAKYDLNGEDKIHHENSLFKKQDGAWYFYDVIKRQPIVKEAEPGRNDPCPCGSGKKYKKCCMSNAA